MIIETVKVLPQVEKDVMIGTKEEIVMMIMKKENDESMIEVNVVRGVSVVTAVKETTTRNASNVNLYLKQQMRHLQDFD